MPRGWPEQRAGVRGGIREEGGGVRDGGQDVDVGGGGGPTVASGWGGRGGWWRRPGAWMGEGKKDPRVLRGDSLNPQQGHVVGEGVEDKKYVTNKVTFSLLHFINFTF